MKRSFAVPLILCVMGILSAENRNLSAGRESVLEVRRSPYASIKVVEEDGVRFLYLGSRLQSGWNPASPDSVVFHYVKLVGAAITAWPGIERGLPAKVLLIGLGGGTICRHVEKYHPGFRMEAVELDPVVHELAVKYFALGDGVKVHIGDGRAFLERTGSRFDIIILDAFGEDYIPRELITREFFELTKSRLSPGGLVIANTHMDIGSDEHERRTYRAVFGPYYELANPEKSGNRIILCGRDGLPEAAILRKRMERAGQALGVREFDVGEILADLRRVDGTGRGVVLTDANVRELVKKRR